MAVSNESLRLDELTRAVITLLFYMYTLLVLFILGRKRVADFTNVKRKRACIGRNCALNLTLLIAIYHTLFLRILNMKIYFFLSLKHKEHFKEFEMSLWVSVIINKSSVHVYLYSLLKRLDGIFTIWTFLCTAQRKVAMNFYIVA